MKSEIFNPMEVSAIGEILNISLGASATAISTMLGKRVDITTPTVRVLSFDEFEFTAMEPAVGVEITYVSGLEGNNILLLKRSDVKLIVETLMGMEIPDEEFELDEMNMSAICEVMNQMMGASSTALSEFLGDVVNISTPISFEVEDEIDFKRKYFPSEEPMVVVSFILQIENIVESEFLSVMSTGLCKRLISAFGLTADAMSSSAAAKQPEQAASQTPEQVQPQAAQQSQAQQPQAAPQMPEQVQPQAAQQSQAQQPQAPQQSQVQQPTQAAQPMPQMQAQQPQAQQSMPQMQQPVYVQPEPKVINVQPMVHQTFGNSSPQLGTEQAENLELIMSVPLEVSVEIGRTKKLVKEILDYTQGTLVILDKLAGEQVDLYVNGQCIAKGDVVVVDDCFGVRITEIVKNHELKLGY